MDRLKKGKVYIGKHHNFPVLFMGLELDENYNWLYQFKELFPKHPNVVGYGQSYNQMRREEYKQDENMTTLYGEV